MRSAALGSAASIAAPKMPPVRCTMVELPHLGRAAPRALEQREQRCEARGRVESHGTRQGESLGGRQCVARGKQLVDELGSGAGARLAHPHDVAPHAVEGWPGCLEVRLRHARHRGGGSEGGAWAAPPLLGT
eukprot:scaffold101924_cov58-Phaeocystis_antarctica.AAC.5